MTEILMEKDFKCQKAARLKQIREINKNQTKMIVDNYRENQNDIQKNEEYLKILEIYKNKSEEIENLKKEKEKLLNNFQKASLDADKNNKILMEYLEKVERKNIEFQEFMRDKGKKALEYFKKENEIKMAKEKEIKKTELKGKVKQIEMEKSKKLAENFREAKNQEKLKENEDMLNYQRPNIIEKVYKSFHNLGNKIDYSNTRFHNVVVVKHDENELNEFISAQEKAVQESLKNENTKKLKKKSLEKFIDDTKISSKDILKKEKAKENLKKLQEELNKINDFRNRNKSSKNLISGVSHNNPKYLEKKSENLANALLNKQRSKSRKKKLRYSSKNKMVKDSPLVKIKEDNNLYSNGDKIQKNPEDDYPSDISQFYQDNEYQEAEKEEKRIEIQNENIRNNIININNDSENVIERRNIQNQNNNSIRDFKIDIKSKSNIEFEDPVLRTTKNKTKEQINRLNPVDIEIYNKIDSTNDFYFHHKNMSYQTDSPYRNNVKNIETRNNNENQKANIHNETNLSYFSVNNFKNTGNPFIQNNLVNPKFSFNKNQFNNNFKQSNNDDYDNVVGKIIRPKEPEINMKPSDKNDKIKNANILVEEFMKDINKGKSNNNNTKKSMMFSKDFNNEEEEEEKTNKNTLNKYTNNFQKNNYFKNNTNETSYEIHKNKTKNFNDNCTELQEEGDHMEKEQLKRDDSKWKYNKNELMERRKKLLKDKSNLNIKNNIIKNNEKTSNETSNDVNRNKSKNFNNHRNELEGAETNVIDNNEFKRDSSKWKYDKNELMERRKRFLKDKTNLKKNKL